MRSEPTPAVAGEAYLRIHGILRAYLSELTTGSLLDSALERTGLDAKRLQFSDLPTLLPRLERGAHLFMKNQHDADAAVQELRRLVSEPVSRRFPVEPPPTSVRLRAVARAAEPPSALPPAKTGGYGKGDAMPEQEARLLIPIVREEDILRARVEARKLTERINAKLTEQTHLATLVSELARNIILYARGGGQIELIPLALPFRGVSVIARDQGPGISNLDQIFNGKYQSKMGMGLGLRGVRNLASFFEISSKIGEGTVVRAQLRVS